MSVEKLKIQETFSLKNLVFFSAPEIMSLDPDKKISLASQVPPLLEALGGEHMLHPTDQEIKKLMDEGLALAITDLTQDNLVGFVKTDVWVNHQKEPAGFEVGSVVVIPELQNKGIGAFLTNEMAETTRKIAGGLPIFSVITDDNFPSLAMYRKLKWPKITSTECMEILGGVDVLEGWIPPSSIFLFRS